MASVDGEDDSAALIRDRLNGKLNRWQRIRRRMREVIHAPSGSGAGEATAKALPQLVMWRTSLADLPPLEMPAGVTCRTMREGDAPAWDTIVSEAFGWPEPTGHFDAHIRPDPFFVPHRVLFLLREGVPVATASAWYKPQKLGVDVGYLHFVAVRPGHTNKGLGTMASLAAMHAMAAEGRTKALLLTDDHRHAAIHIYLKLGFTPLVTHESHPERWRASLRQLPDKSLFERFAGNLDTQM